jgi:predicted  nucleic acid-binding Zn-ribbon protein
MPHQCIDCGRAFADGSKEMLSGCPDCGGNKFQFKPAGQSSESTTADEPVEEPPDPPDPPVDSSVARTVGNAATAVKDLVGSGSSTPSTGDAAGATAQQSEPAEAYTPQGSTEDASVTAGNSTRSPAESTSATVSTDTATSSENEAQASARSDVVEPGDLPSSFTSSPAPSPASDERSRADPADSTGFSDKSRTAETAPPEAGQEDAPDTGEDDTGLSEIREELNQQFESIRVLEPGQYELNLMELYDREEYIIALQEDGKYTIQVPERWED